MRDKIRKHLFDFKEAALAIFQFVHGKKFEDYEQNELLRSGVGRKFGIIGEALNRIKNEDTAVLDKIRDYRNIISFQEYSRIFYIKVRPQELSLFLLVKLFAVVINSIFQTRLCFFLNYWFSQRIGGVQEIKNWYGL